MSTKTKSYAPEVIADDSGQWTGNALRFATEDEAERYVKGLRARWFLVTDTRVVESDDPVRNRLDEDGKLSEVENRIPSKVMTSGTEVQTTNDQERA